MIDDVRNRLTILCLAGGLLFSCCSAARSDEVAITPSGKIPSITTATADTKPIFLWKCKKGNQLIYLLGTIHVARPGFYPLPREMESALNESSILFVEADVLQDSGKVNDTLRRIGLYTPPATLTENLSPSTADALNQYIEWSGESLSMYQAYKPWVVSQILTSGAIRRAGYKAELGIDRHLLSQAHASAKKIIPLESLESQLNLVSSFDKTTQEKQLLGSIISLRDSKSDMEKIENSWKNGDASALASLGVNDVDADKDIQNAKVALLDKRNSAMLVELNKHLPPQGSVLVAVGAAHLVGEHGLLAKLKEQEYTVEQVNTTLAKKTTSINFGARNLKRLYFPEGLFRIMLPGDPEVKYETLNNIRMVDYAYSNLGGAMTVSYIIMPAAISSADKQKQFMQIIASAVVKKSRGTNVSFVPSQKKSGAMELSFKLPTKAGIAKQDQYLRCCMILSGRRLYLIGGQGTVDFFKSRLYSEFENSLEIIPEQGFVTASAPVWNQRKQTSSSSSLRTPQPDFQINWQGASRSTSPTYRAGGSNSKVDFDSLRAEHLRKSEELRSKVRSDFERVRNQMQQRR